MKRLLLFAALIVSGAMMMTSQAKWELGDQINASQIQSGDTVILEYVASQFFAGQYLALNDQYQSYTMDSNGKNILPLSDNNIWVFEEGPEDVRVAGGKTFYLKHVASGRYVVASGGYSSPFSTATDISNASPLYIASCGEDLPFSNCKRFDGDGDNLNDGLPDGTDKIVNWGVNGDGQGAVSDNSVGFLYNSSETSWSYMTNYWGNIGFTGLQMCNQWNVYRAKYTDDRHGDLDALITSYQDFTPIGGTDPGYYEQSAADNYNSVLQSAVLLNLNGGTNAEYIKAMADLTAAYRACRNSMIPITAGYYNIVSAYDGFLSTQGVEKAMYTDELNNVLAWNTLDTSDPAFLFYITPTSDANLYYIQNYETDLYAGPQPEWFAGTTSLTTTPDITKRLTMEVEGMFLFTGSEHEYPGMAGGVSPFRNSTNDSQVSGSLVAWGRVNNNNDQEYIFTNHTNLWYIRPVDDATVEAMAAAKAQYQRTKQAYVLLEDAYELYPKLFSFDTQTTGLITVAGVQGHDFDHPIDGNQITYTNPIHDDDQTRDVFTNDYAFLIDGNDRTYVSSRGGYVQVDLSKTPQQTLTFSFLPRYGNGSTGDADSMALARRETPNQITIYASNGGTYKRVAKGTVGNLSNPVNFSVTLDSAYSYFRYYVNQNVGGGSFFCLSEFQVYPATVNQQNSQYYATTGLKAAADNMYAMLPDIQTALNNNTVTAEQVSNLSAAIAAVRELYADTVALSELIAQSQTLLEGVQVGEGMGQLSSQTLATNLQTAITNARNTAFASPINVEAVRTATNAISTARAAFLAGLKTPEEGKWYFITNLDNERTGEAGTEDAQCGGSAIYLNNVQSNGSITKWGLYDAASASLNADNNPAAMWRVVKVDSANNYYAIQNLMTGYYLGNFAGDNINLPVSETAVPYEIAYNGNAQFLLYPRSSSNTSNEALWPEGAANDVVCHATGTPASAWTFVEIDPAEQEAISISNFRMNAMDVMTLPYNVSDFNLNNPDAHTYAVKSMSQETNAAGELVTTIEFYEKNDFQAGEPCLLVVGDTASAAETEDFQLLIPFPTEIVDHSHNCVSNGLLGGLHSTSVGEGTGISDLKKFTAVGEEGSGFSAQTGVIDPGTYTNAVDGVETAFTLTVTGLKAIGSASNKADVNGDGQVNSSDVVAIYNYISDAASSGYTLEQADVNEDGQVNSSDAVEIYNQIAGASAASKGFSTLLKLK